MKSKKHYNSFHPKAGFFLDIDEVMSWFDAEDFYFGTVSFRLSFETANYILIYAGIFKKAELDPKHYEALLKEDLVCFHCGSSMKNIPTLKAHLAEEWDKIASREKARLEKKRKFEEKRAAKGGTSEEVGSKRLKSSSEDTWWFIHTWL